MNRSEESYYESYRYTKEDGFYRKTYGFDFLGVDLFLKFYIADKKLSLQVVNSKDVKPLGTYKLPLVDCVELQKTECHLVTLFLYSLNKMVDNFEDAIRNSLKHGYGLEE